MYALTAVLISIGGIDKGTAYKTIAKQINEIHKAEDKCFESVWRRFDSQSTVDGDRVRIVEKWKQHWSSEMSRDGQMIHATYFPKLVPNDAFKRLMGATSQN